jgi:hypothetical protein
VWQRTLLEAPGRCDTTSRVYWLQTKSWHADIRVPADRPAVPSNASLQQLPREILLALARQQGFAGITQVDGDICRWLRKVDYQPPTGANDIGRMQFDSADRVIERGVEANYLEIWERLPESLGATSVSGFPIGIADGAAPSSLLLTAGECFVLVHPRSGDLPRAESLLDLARHMTDARLAAALDFEISFGWRDATGDVGRIELSTLPWREGESVALRG